MQAMLNFCNRFNLKIKIWRENTTIQILSGRSIRQNGDTARKTKLTVSYNTQKRYRLSLLKDISGPNYLKKNPFFTT